MTQRRLISKLPRKAWLQQRSGAVRKRRKGRTCPSKKKRRLGKLCKKSSSLGLIGATGVTSGTIDGSSDVANVDGGCRTDIGDKTVLTVSTEFASSTPTEAVGISGKEEGKQVTLLYPLKRNDKKYR